MARYIIEQRITCVSELKSFDSAGYQYNDLESTATELVFKRAET
jgi:cytoplasmic iron level regulating protein YaaA (DUF328/UPF0246 family)